MQKKVHKYILDLFIVCIVVGFISSWIVLLSLLMRNIPVEFVTYRGDGYTANYPKGWTVEKNKEFGFITITGNGASAFFSTFDDGKKTLSQQLDRQLDIFRLGFKNFKQIESKRTVNLKNGSWLEAGGICDTTLKDGTKMPFREVSVVTSHMIKAGSIKLFTIDYITGINEFASSEQKFFQPIWQSFKFL